MFQGLLGPVLAIGPFSHAELMLRTYIPVYGAIQVVN